MGPSKGASPADQTLRQSSHDSGGCRSGESSRRNSGGSTSRAESTRILSGGSLAAVRAQRTSGPEGRLVVQDSARLDGCLPLPRDAGKDSRPGAPQSAGERAREQRRQQGRAMEALQEERPAGGSDGGAKPVAIGSVGAAHKLALGALQRKIGTSGAAVRYLILPHHLCCVQLALPSIRRRLPQLLMIFSGCKPPHQMLELLDCELIQTCLS